MSELNSMCLDCICRGTDCDGTTEQVWTGCVYRQIKTTEPSAWIPMMMRESMESRNVPIDAINRV